MAISLGSYGAFASKTEFTPALAAHVEGLGFTTAWVGTSPSGDLALIETLLDATKSLVVATAVINIWQDDAVDVAASFHRVNARHPDRFLLGVGVGHAEGTPHRYRAPYSALAHYLHELDDAGVPKQQRVIAALGPRMLGLAQARANGAHPFLVTAAHTRSAREVLGQGPMLAPVQNVVCDRDATVGRDVGRANVVAPYLTLENYRRSFLRLGFTEQDFESGGSDRLVDSLVCRGDGIADRLQEHRDAGADHVAVRVVETERTNLFEGYAQVAESVGFPAGNGSSATSPFYVGGAAQDSTR